MGAQLALTLALAGVLALAPVANAATLTIEQGDDWRPGHFVTTSVMRACGSGDLGLGYPSDAGARPLVATWRFDCPTGPARDTEGDHDGILSGPDRVPGGVFDTRAARFDGTDDAIWVPTDPELNPDAFTLAFWVNPDTTGEQQFLVTKAGDADRGYAVDLTSEDRFRLQIGTGTGYTALATDTQAVAGQWYHVAATYDAETEAAQLFVNGSLDAESTEMGTIADDDDPLVFGTHANAPDLARFDGRLDEIRFYDDALAPATVDRISLDYADGLLDGTYETTLEHEITRIWRSVTVHATVPTWTDAWLFIVPVDEDGNQLDKQRIILNSTTQTVDLDLPVSSDLRIEVEGWSHLPGRTWAIEQIDIDYALDHDADRLATVDEQALGTDPHDPDTDDDGLDDGPEVHTWGTDPLDADTDGDLHRDGTEVDEGADPLDALSIPLVVTATPGTGIQETKTLGATDPLPPVR